MKEPRVISSPIEVKKRKNVFFLIYYVLADRASCQISVVHIAKKKRNMAFFPPHRVESERPPPSKIMSSLRSCSKSERAPFSGFIPTTPMKKSRVVFHPQRPKIEKILFLLMSPNLLNKLTDFSSTQQWRNLVLFSSTEFWKWKTPSTRRFSFPRSGSKGEGEVFLGFHSYISNGGT